MLFRLIAAVVPIVIAQLALAQPTPPLPPRRPAEAPAPAAQPEVPSSRQGGCAAGRPGSRHMPGGPESCRLRRRARGATSGLKRALPDRGAGAAQGGPGPDKARNGRPSHTAAHPRLPLRGSVRTLARGFGRATRRRHQGSRVEGCPHRSRLRVPQPEPIRDGQAVGPCGRARDRHRGVRARERIDPADRVRRSARRRIRPSRRSGPRHAAGSRRSWGPARTRPTTTTCTSISSSTGRATAIASANKGRILRRRDVSGTEICLWRRCRRLFARAPRRGPRGVSAPEDLRRRARRTARKWQAGRYLPPAHELGRAWPAGGGARHAG